MKKNKGITIDEAQHYLTCLKTLKSTKYVPSNKDFICICNREFTAKDFISHINKFHPPQAPKEWICKHKSLKYECKKCNE